MSKQKDFNTILDECLDRLLFNGETPEQCLGDYPDLADELRPLLEAAVMTSGLSALGPDPAFKSRARTELHAVLREAEEKRSRSFFSFEWQWSRVTAAVAAVLVLLVGVGGTAYAATGSMPDDFLYPVKRATEQVQLAFTFTSLGKAEAYARIANTRIEEIIYLANADKPEAEISLLASTLNSNLENIAELSYETHRKGVTTESADSGGMAVTTAMSEERTVSKGASIPDTVTGETAESRPETEEETVAEAPQSVVTPDADESIDIAMEQPEAAKLFTAPAAEAAASRPVFEEPKEAWLTGTPKQQLNASIINQANSNIQRLRELLDVVPESVRPAIERAIALSEAGYEIAINSLK